LRLRECGRLLVKRIGDQSVIIDIDHWRHYFLVLGVLWGLIAASRAYLAQPHAPA